MRSCKSRVTRQAAGAGIGNEPVLGGQCRLLFEPAFQRAVESHRNARKAEPAFCRLSIEIADQRLPRRRHRDGRFRKAGLDS